MKEIVFISGKGGTGKTTVSASFAVLAKNAVIADCDVDASDLHLVLNPIIKKTEDFFSGYKAFIDKKKCISCGACLAFCRFDAVKMKSSGESSNEHSFIIDELSCEGCGVCVRECPANAIFLNENYCGKIFDSETRFGRMIHASLNPGSGNSGKLVSVVRRKARELAEINGAELIITDGSPGIACPVIASITGASYLFIVTEPTISGIHDLKRILSLAEHFKIPCAVCVNKYDINERVAKEIINFVNSTKLVTYFCRISYDKNATAAQINGKTIVEYADSLVSREIKKIWNDIQFYLSN